MQQVISNHKIHLTRQESIASRTSATSLINMFIAWCNLQEENRFLWLAVSLLGGIGTVLPITLMAIVFGADNNFSLWVIACIVNVPILIVNLAAQPQKFILPVLFFAWIVDAIIVVYCLTLFFVR